MNRNAVGGLVYTLRNGDDTKWWDIFQEKHPHKEVTYDELISTCLNSGAAKGVLRYDLKADNESIPQMFTMAAVLDAVPFADSSKIPKLADGSEPKLIFDLSKEWAGFDSYSATKYLYENHLQDTTGLAKMNPGFASGKAMNPPLTGTANVGLADYIVKEKMFNMFMWNNCIPTTKEHALFNQIAKENPWPRPVGVMGYDNTWPLFGGDIFEAETNCDKYHNMGQIASSGVNNLSFLSQNRITEPLKQPHAGITHTFDANKTYMSFVIGDGDNVSFMKGSRKTWFDTRIQYCKDQKAAGKACFPLLWTASP